MSSFADSTDHPAASHLDPQRPDDLLKLISGRHSLQFEASTPALEVVCALGQTADQSNDYAVILNQQQFVGLITLKEIMTALAAGVALAECPIGSLTLRLASLEASELSDLLAVYRQFQQQQAQYLPVLQQRQFVGVLALEQVAAQFYHLLANPVLVNPALPEQALADRAAAWIKPPEPQPASFAQPAHSTSLFQLANISHEMRASLSGIAAFVELLSGDVGVISSYSEALDCIAQTCRYLMALTDDICLFSQLEANRALPRQQTCNLHELLKDLKQRFQIQARAKRLEFSLEQDGALPQYILTDPVKLRRILDNLLSNAIKFTPQGKVTLKLTVRDWIYFEVRDTGVGIALHEQEAIFEPFVQAAAGRQSAQGVGLGLAISQRLAQMLGGEIQISSSLGQGTTARLALPVQKRCSQQPEVEPLS